MIERKRNKALKVVAAVAAVIAAPLVIALALGITVEPTQGVRAQLVDPGGGIVPPTSGGGGGGGGGAVNSVSGAFGITVTGTASDPIVGANSSQMQQRVSGTCPVGQAIRVIDGVGAVTCEVDDNSGGIVTSLSSTGGITIGGTAAVPIVGADATVIQSRVSGTCPAGQAIRAVAQNGTVTCEVDDGSAHLFSDVPSTAEVYISQGGSIDPFTTTNSGTGAGTAAFGTSFDAHRPMILQQTTGSTATGRSGYGIGCSAGANVVFDPAVPWAFAVGVYFEDLSTVGETYVWRSGFKDALGADATDGCYFRYDDSASTELQCVCANAGVRTIVNSGVTVAADTWYDLKINVATNATFEMDGAAVCGTISTNVPTGTARATAICTEPVKSVGTTARLVYLDYMYARPTGLTGRN